jgi:hypothetical protein
MVPILDAQMASSSSTRRKAPVENTPLWYAVVVGLPDSGKVPRTNNAANKDLEDTLTEEEVSSALLHRIWEPTGSRRVYRVWSVGKHSLLARIAADFYPKVYQKDITKNKDIGILFAKACVAHYRKIPVNWAVFAFEQWMGRSGWQRQNWKPHYRWQMLYDEDDEHLGVVTPQYSKVLELDADYAKPPRTEGVAPGEVGVPHSFAGGTSPRRRPNIPDEEGNMSVGLVRQPRRSSTFARSSNADSDGSYSPSRRIRIPMQESHSRECHRKRKQWNSLLNTSYPNAGRTLRRLRRLRDSIHSGFDSEENSEADIEAGNCPHRMTNDAGDEECEDAAVAESGAGDATNASRRAAALSHTSSFQVQGVRDSRLDGASSGQNVPFQDARNVERGEGTVQVTVLTDVDVATNGGPSLPPSTVMIATTGGGYDQVRAGREADKETADSDGSDAVVGDAGIGPGLDGAHLEVGITNKAVDNDSLEGDGLQCTHPRVQAAEDAGDVVAGGGVYEGVEMFSDASGIRHPPVVHDTAAGAAETDSAMDVDSENELSETNVLLNVLNVEYTTDGWENEVDETGRARSTGIVDVHSNAPHIRFMTEAIARLGRSNVTNAAEALRETTLSAYTEFEEQAEDIHSLVQECRTLVEDFSRTHSPQTVPVASGASGEDARVVAGSEVVVPELCSRGGPFHGPCTATERLKAGGARTTLSGIHGTGGSTRRSEERPFSPVPEFSPLDVGPVNNSTGIRSPLRSTTSPKNDAAGNALTPGLDTVDVRVAVAVAGPAVQYSFRENPCIGTLQTPKPECLLGGTIVSGNCHGCAPHTQTALESSGHDGMPGQHGMAWGVAANVDRPVPAAVGSFLPIDRKRSYGTCIRTPGGFEGNLRFQTTEADDQPLSMEAAVQMPSVGHRPSMYMSTMMPILLALANLSDQLRHFCEVNGPGSSAGRVGEENGRVPLRRASWRDEASTSTAAPRSREGSDFLLRNGNTAANLQTEFLE